MINNTFSNICSGAVFARKVEEQCKICSLKYKISNEKFNSK